MRFSAVDLCEAGEVADLGEDRCHNDRTDALERLEGAHLRRPRRVCQHLLDLRLELDVLALARVAFEKSLGL